MKKTNSSTKEHIKISMEKPMVMEICSDYDETTLRHVHKSKWKIDMKQKLAAHLLALYNE